MNTQAATLNAEFLDRLRGFVRKRVRTEHDAQDIVQDVLTKLVQHSDSIGIGGTESVYAWLFTVARRAIIDRARAAQAAENAHDDQANRIAAEVANDPSATADLARCMEPMLELLSAEDRIVLQRVDMLGQSQADIARELGMSNSGLKSRVQRARQRLRALLEDCCTVERDRLGLPVDYQRNTAGPCPCSDSETTCP